jgi:hypothetical protein
MHRSLWLAPLLVLQLACSGSGGGVGHIGASDEAGFTQSSARAKSGTRMIIREASADLVVEDLGKATTTIESRVAEIGGHVTSSNLNADGARLLLRVPSTKLDEFLDVVAKLGEEENRSVTGRDVTDEYSDIEAEIGNLVSLRDRLRALLDRADEVDEVLRVERELTRVQTQLDSLTGRRERMANDVQLSAVTLSLSKREPKRVLGPLGLLYEGTKWFAIKLFVISP